MEVVDSKRNAVLTTPQSIYKPSERMSDEPPSKISTARTALSNSSGEWKEAKNMKDHDPTTLRKFFEGITKIMGGISTLGVGFTFNFILNDLHSPPPHARFDADQVRFFLAMSWFLFIVGLTVSSFVTLLLNFWGNDLVKYWNKHRAWDFASFAMSMLLATTLVAPFVFVCLVIIAYQKEVGIAGISLVGIVWCVSLIAAIVRLRIDLEDTKNAIMRSVWTE